MQCAKYKAKQRYFELWNMAIMHPLATVHLFLLCFKRKHLTSLFKAYAHSPCYHCVAGAGCPIPPVVSICRASFIIVVVVNLWITLFCHAGQIVEIAWHQMGWAGAKKLRIAKKVIKSHHEPAAGYWLIRILLVFWVLLVFQVSGFYWFLDILGFIGFLDFIRFLALLVFWVL